MDSHAPHPLRAAVVLICATCAVACDRSPKPEQRTGEVELRSAEGPGAPATPIKDERNAFLAVVRREQLALRAHVQEEIDAVDRRLAELKVAAKGDGVAVDPRSKHAAHIKALLDRRAQLEEDAHMIDRADERGWDELKATVEKDIESSKSERGPRRGE